MLFLEYANWELMMLMAGMMGNQDILAAQVIISTVGSLLLMVPYGLSVSAVAMIGQALGSNNAELAKRNTVMVFLTSGMAALVTCLILGMASKQIIGIYNEDSAVKSACLPAFSVFAVAFFFDWMASQMTGFIKACGQQKIAAVVSTFSMIFVSVPIGYFCGFLLDMKLPGLMIGYGLQGMILIIVYGIILVKLDWKNVALQASLSEEEESNSYRPAIDFEMNLQSKFAIDLENVDASESDSSGESTTADNETPRMLNFRLSLKLALGPEEDLEPSKEEKVHVVLVMHDPG